MRSLGKLPLFRLRSLLASSKPCDQSLSVAILDIQVLSKGLCEAECVALASSDLSCLNLLSLQAPLQAARTITLGRWT